MIIDRSPQNGFQELGMVSFSNLDIAIGLIFVILMISLICTAINEWIAQLFALRAGTLRNGIKQILEDPLARRFYDHQLIMSLRHQGNFDKLMRRGGDPSYIPPSRFAATLVDLANNPDGPGTGQSAQTIRDAIAQLPEGRAKDSLAALFAYAAPDDAKDRLIIEQWFDENMDRVTGQYKRRLQIITIGVAVVVTVLVNADAIVIANTLRGDPVLREAVVNLARETVEQGSFFATPTPTEISQAVTDATTTPTPASGAATPADAGSLPATTTDTPVPTATVPARSLDTERVERLLGQTEKLGLPLGWDEEKRPKDPQGWIGKIVGLLIMAAAVSLGAPFWFDMLNKIVNVRAAGPKPGADTTTTPSTSATGAATGGTTGMTGPTQ
jgi:hypothetical protein